MSVSQKDGVFGAVVAYLEEKSIPFEEGAKAVDLSTDARKTIVGMLVAATEAGELTRKSNKSGQSLEQYWSGTLSNWLRRDPRLNGGVEKVEPKNPGSRAGSGDAELRELKKLMQQVEVTGNAEHITAVQEAIDNRMKIVEAEKAKKIAVDLSKIDPSLLASIGVKLTDSNDE